MESMHCLREAMSCYCKSTPSVVSEKNWNTKDDKGCIHCSPVVDEQTHLRMSNSKEIKPPATFIAELHLAEGISE